LGLRVPKADETALVIGDVHNECIGHLKCCGLKRQKERRHRKLQTCSLAYLPYKEQDKTLSQHIALTKLTLIIANRTLTSASLAAHTLAPPPRSDWRVLLRGVLRLDAEGPEDGVRRGHHRHPHPQAEEGGAEEETGPALHQLLPDHLMPRAQRAPPPRSPFLLTFSPTEGRNQASHGQ